MRGRFEALSDHLDFPISSKLGFGKGTVAHVPAGTAIDMSVSTNALPRAGIVVSWALQMAQKESATPAGLLTTIHLSQCAHESHLYKSYPAAYALPLVGVFALAESFLTSKGGLCSTLVVGVDSGIVRLWL